MHPMHDDHDDFGGLDRDLPRLLGRRRALGLLTGGAVAVGLAACGSSGSDASDTSTSTTDGTASTDGSGGGSGGGSTDGGGSVTEAVAEETAGPYPGDGSNGPNVLDDAGVVRQDIRSSFGEASGTAEGVELRLDLRLIDLAGGGGPKAGAAVYAWHCTADGEYSLYTGSATDENYLRGVQVADDDGNLSFVTVFPGAYPGRYPHVHFEVYESVEAATSGGRKLVTSQLALPADACEAVYATPGYEQSATAFPQTPLDGDGIFADGWSTQLATVTGTPADGMVATLNLAV
jgi:protocatechuate 3,4-dioxygenase beta subunit